MDGVRSEIDELVEWSPESRGVGRGCACRVVGGGLAGVVVAGGECGFGVGLSGC